VTFDDACALILSDPKANGYAQAYAQAGLTLTDANARRVQALYILNNLSRWRHPQAKEVRATLKLIGEVK
jgi:hypothetical protein